MKHYVFNILAEYKKERNVRPLYYLFVGKYNFFILIFSFIDFQKIYQNAFSIILNKSKRFHFLGERRGNSSEYSIPLREGISYLPDVTSIILFGLIMI